jgi:hypothetical protein
MHGGPHGRKNAPMKPTQPSRRRRQRRPGSSLADGVICRYAYAACFSSGFRIMCTCPPPAAAAAAATYSGEDRMSRRLVYPCWMPSSSGTSIAGGGACFVLGVRQRLNSKSPSGRTPPFRVGASATTAGADGMAETRSEGRELWKATIAARPGRGECGGSDVIYTVAPENSGRGPRVVDRDGGVVWENQERVEFGTQSSETETACRRQGARAPWDHWNYCIHVSKGLAACVTGFSSRSLTCGFIKRRE